jgi:hypothetical protein
MLLNIIHLETRSDRWSVLIEEIKSQGITDYRIWPGIQTLQPKTGISNAHKQIVAHAQAFGQPQVIIGEDDLRFTAKNSYRYFLEQLPIDFDLYLGGIMYGKIKTDKTVNRFAGLTLYMVHQRFYETFLQLPDNKHLDQALDNKGRYIVCDPMVITQYDGYSDNHKKIREYDYYQKHYSFLKDPGQ